MSNILQVRMKSQLDTEIERRQKERINDIKKEMEDKKRIQKMRLLYSQKKQKESVESKIRAKELDSPYRDKAFFNLRLNSGQQTVSPMKEVDESIKSEYPLFQDFKSLNRTSLGLSAK